MFIQLKAHKAHVYSQTDIDPSKKNIVLIPGAGMDHRTLSMFKLDSIKETHNVIAFDLPGHGYTTGPLFTDVESCLLYTSPSPRDGLLSRMPSSA